jgi:hypothetical protein
MSRPALPLARLGITLCALLGGLSAPAFAQTQDLRLTWDANPEPDIVHYTVYIGTAPGAHNVVVQRVAATQQTAVFAATPGVLYYLAVSATNAAGLEGPLSYEISASIPSLSQPADRTSAVGVPVVPLNLSASDPDGGSLRFSHIGLPLGLVLDPVTGTITGIPTALGTYSVTIIVSDGVLRSQRSFVWAITSPASLTADGATPNAGAGSAQTFSLQYSSSLGVTNVSTAWVWFSASVSASSSNSCLLYYSRGTSMLYLLDDGQTWMAGALGSSTLLQNSQCAVSLSGSSATFSGNSLTLNLAMTFSAAYSGAKNIYMYAQNDANQNSGWQDRGDWTVPSGVAALRSTASITADTVTPNSGSGAVQTFSLRYSDTLGATDLWTVWAWFNSSFTASSANSCLSFYDRATGLLHLLDDGATWMSGTLGSSGQLQNSQCIVSLSSSSVSIDGNTLTLNLAMIFKGTYGGTKRLYAFAQNAQYVNSGWQYRGDWTVPAGSSVVTADSATPGTGVGSTQTFALQYAANLGATDLSHAWVWFSAAFTPSASNSCLLYYDRAANQLYLLDDGSSWMGGTLGTFGTLQNSQCSVSLQTSSATLNGSTLTLYVAMTFTSSYAGDKRIFMFARNANNVNSGWQDRGQWTVP